jgi:hypothetical protein
MKPIKRRRNMEMLVLNVFLAVMATGLMIWVYRIGDGTLMIRGMKASGGVFATFFILIILISLVTGFAIVLSQHYDTWLRALLNSDREGTFTTALAGMLFPSLSGMPVAKELWFAGLNHKNLMVFFGVAVFFNMMPLLIRGPMMPLRVMLVLYAYQALVTTLSIPFFRWLGRWL